MTGDQQAAERLMKFVSQALDQDPLTKPALPVLGFCLVALPTPTVATIATAVGMPLWPAVLFGAWSQVLLILAVLRWRAKRVARLALKLAREADQ